MYPPHDIYISFSGGKDSTVLKHLVENQIGNIESVFFNTGLELSSIQRFVSSFGNVTVLRPEILFKDVIIKYGYPCIGKEFAEAVSAYRKGSSWAIDKFNGTGRYSGIFSYKKFKWILDAPFRISSKCCYFMKKKTSHDYNVKNVKYPIIATLADESLLRRTMWQRYGCNITGNNPHSNPMSFWTENDILKYIYENKVKIADCYGNVICKDGKYVLDGQRSRTGCAFCLFGAHLENSKYRRFIYLKKYQRSTYEYIMGGGEYDSEGYWIPNDKGLGFSFVIEFLNRYLKKPIIYDIKTERINLW